MRLSEIETPKIYSDPLYVQYKNQIDFALDKYINQKSAIYKGGSYVLNQLYWRDPMEFEKPRISQNTRNYYTLWMDSSEKWSHYPKRSRSIIASSSRSYAEDFGASLGVVVPTVDCAIGICAGQDLWYSFYKTAGAGMTLDTFNSFIGAALRISGQALKPITVEQLKKSLAKIDLNDPKYEELRDWGDLFYIAFKQGGLPQLMDYVFDPAKNRFKLTTWKQYKLIHTDNREVWLNAPCVVVPISIWEQLASLRHKESAGK